MGNDLFAFSISDVNFIIVQPEISRQAFVQLVVEQFPVVAADILDEDWAGLIHLQVACLTRHANKCVASGDLPEFTRMLRFVDYVLPKVDSALDNALHVSFIEDLMLDGDAPLLQVARQLLSPKQLEFYVAIRNWETTALGQR
ncbi:hypothetical protein QMK33_18240 [Hymenobacter sp. H14-R3]|uniref:DUF7674 family protein n=1 Tax=Hymenobacter sp. H14-R3 TaxID=3046308 RepID=UPI0024BA4CD2|nr:hypothetical protein [Hymenobacter sp. H14-R3]MDJ0367094.1 hypothetical protein [Hymenobacter sp. H14-R3]